METLCSVVQSAFVLSTRRQSRSNSKLDVENWIFDGERCWVRSTNIRLAATTGVNGLYCYATVGVGCPNLMIMSV